MKLGFFKSVVWLNSIQVVLYLLGFFSWAQSAVGDVPFLAIYQWNLFSIMFWSLISVIGITGLVFSVYTLVTIKPKKIQVLFFQLQVMPLRYSFVSF